MADRLGWSFRPTNPALLRFGQRHAQLADEFTVRIDTAHGGGRARSAAYAEQVGPTGGPGSRETSCWQGRSAAASASCATSTCRGPPGFVCDCITARIARANDVGVCGLSRCDRGCDDGWLIDEATNAARRCESERARSRRVRSVLRELPEGVRHVDFDRTSIKDLDDVIRAALGRSVKYDKRKVADGPACGSKSTRGPARPRSWR